MGTTTELNDELRGGRVRLSRVRQVVEELDRKIAGLERRKDGAQPRERVGVMQEIRVASEQRLAAIELVDLAEAQLAEREQRFGEAKDKAKRELGRTAQTCMDAAQRFDRALRESVAALGEIEAAADPIRPFLPNGITSYTHPRNLHAAFRHAFAERLGPAERLSEQKSMSERIGQMIADARQNSSDQGDRRVA